MISKIFSVLHTGSAEDLIDYRLHDTVTNPEGGTTEKMTFLADTSTYGINPLEALILQEEIEELLKSQSGE